MWDIWHCNCMIIIFGQISKYSPGLKSFRGDVYRKEIQSVFPSIAGVLTHVYLSDKGWFDVFSGERLEDTLKSAEQQKRGHLV